ncbi:Mbeg1-like protein [Pseudactinotalea sp.]|uniref:Mbeg1-like protein n=1 Tax=Pseudactinotalea sp. TaxID=1926260 RepID=UPI003B3A0669
MNLQDYLRWRGDLTFAERAFNTVDNLALAAISYLNLADIVPSTEEGGSISVREAADVLVRRRSLAGQDPALAFEERRLPIVDSSVLTDMGRSARFGEARLSDFVDLLDPEGGVQFSAVTITLGDGTTYVSYRGTDWTILGWREDFTMSFETIPAQLAAADYLKDRVAAAPRAVRVGGHSKGGNLAVYAAMAVDDDVQDRLLAVYSNDGPGLAPEIAQPERLARLGDRIVKIVPEFAVVGLLFDTIDHARIVRSDAPGILQHYITSWQVTATDIVEADRIAPRATVIEQAFEEWLENVGPAERKTFTQDFFEALGAGGATLVTEIGDQDFGGFESVLVTFGRHRGETRHAIRLAARAVLRAIAEINYRRLLQHSTTVRALGLALIGLLFVVQPVLWAQIVSSLGLFALFAVVVGRVLIGAIQRWEGLRPRARSIVALGLTLGLATAAILLLQSLVAPSKALLGVLLLLNAWYQVRRGFTLRQLSKRQLWRTVLLYVSGAVSLLLGVLVLSYGRELVPALILSTGQYLLVAGLLEVAILLRDQVGRRYASAAATLTMSPQQVLQRWGARPPESQ